METCSRDGYGSVWSRHVRQSYHLMVYLTIGFSSALDDISGETVAIKMVTRIFDKVQLAKRALREVTLLRHFANHENITGLIDVDAVSPDFNEMYVDRHFLRYLQPYCSLQLHIHGGEIKLTPRISSD